MAHRRTSVIVAVLAILAMQAGVAGAAARQHPPDAAIDGRYIVVLRDGRARPAAVAAQHHLRYHARVTQIYRHAIRGYAARLDAAGVRSLRADPRVAFVVRDGIASIQETQQDAPWGLDRIDQRRLPLNGTFRYGNTGAGVTAYVIDTGVRVSHTEFGGRARSGWDFVDGDADASDCHGHGTHVAGTIGGATYGVAKAVDLVAVRVLDCAGFGSWSDIIAGIDWVTADHAAGQPAVANMSLGGGPNSAVDLAVRNSIADGIAYALAAGNGNANACQSSPARVTEAMTVGASTSADAKASFSNWGSCMDWFAPGQGITSAWRTSDTATATISGTSMASPHTAGVAALVLQSRPGASPKAVADAIRRAATPGRLSGLDRRLNPGTADLLLFTDE